MTKIRTPHLILCLLVTLMLTANLPTSAAIPDNTVPTPQQVLSDDPIRINGNDDLLTQAQTNDWTLGGTRDGSRDLPFVISAYTFDTFDEPGIRIENTDLSIRLQSISLIIGGDNVSAVELKQVKNLLFISSDILVYSANNTGVLLNGCDNIRLVNLSIHGTTKDETGTSGVRIQTSRNINLVGSSFQLLTNGVLARNSMHSVLEQSTFENLNNTAIQLNSSTQFFIRVNTILDGYGGISLYDSNQNYVFENYLAAVDTGIMSYGCHLNRFYSNQVGDPSYPYMRAPILALGLKDSYNEFVFLNNLTFSSLGLLVYEGSYDNYVHWNNLFNNSFPFIPRQAMDENGTSEYRYNYFGDHNLTDSDQNGFADEPYQMWDTPVFDNYSLTTPVEHTPSAVTEPVLNQDYLGSISVNWEPLTTSRHSDISYNLYYRAYTEDTWHLITSELSSTTYQWDISGLDNGKYVLVLSSYFNGTDRTVEISKPFFVKNHVLTSLAVTYPNGGETISGAITVEWTPAIDNYGQLVYYSLYFSADNGGSWKTIVELIEDTKYTVDLAQVDYGDNCLIRVVATNEDRMTIEDLSDAVFTVEDVTAPSSSSTSTHTTTLSRATTTGRTDDQSATPTVGLDAYSWTAILISFAGILPFKRRRYR